MISKANNNKLQNNKNQNLNINFIIHMNFYNKMIHKDIQNLKMKLNNKKV